MWCREASESKTSTSPFIVYPNSFSVGEKEKERERKREIEREEWKEISALVDSFSSRHL